jgi:predicted AAA+ superfamily ATPase
MDSFFARDIQRLFAFRDINRFNALFEYVLRQSGGPLDRTRAAAAIGISRPTVESHLQALEITHAITLVRPFHGGGQKELVKMPKVYGFDSGLSASRAAGTHCARTSAYCGSTSCWSTSRRISRTCRSVTGGTRRGAR